MRSLLSFILASSLGLSAGCTSGLWGPFAQDTDSSCNVNPGICATDQTCNPLTGLCEGGSATVDMAQPPAGDSPFRDGHDISIPATSYFNMALGDVTKGEKIDIMLSADTGSVLLLSGDDNFDPAKTETIDLGATNIPSHLLPFANSTKDIFVAALSGVIYWFYKSNGTTTKVVGPSMVGPGYLLLDVGYADNNDSLDLVVTSSKLALAAQVFNGGAAVSSGNAAIFFGPLSSATIPVSKTLNTSDLSFAAARRSNAGLGMALATPGGTSTRILPVMSSSSIGAPISQSPMPPHDIALPIDLDKDGDLDLVLIKTLEVQSGNNFVHGNVDIKINQGNTASAAFTQDPINIDASYLIGAQVDDYDGDGLPDIVVANYAEKKFSVYHNIGPNSSGSPFVATYQLTGNYGARIAYFYDVDGDGCKDLVALFGGDTNSGQGTEIKIQRGRFKAGGTCG